MGIFRALVLGFLGFSATRLAVALGMPLDQWIADFAAWVLSSPEIISREQAIWGAMTFVGVVLLTLELWFKPVGKIFTRRPIILAKLETTVSPIGDFTPACAIRVTNTGPELEEKCLVQIEGHGLKMLMPDPFVIRTEGQIRGNRTGRFTLATGQAKLVPILFRVPAHLGHFQFIGEDGKNYDFVGDSAEFVVAIYGADNPTKVRVRLSDGQDWKPNFEMEYC